MLESLLLLQQLKNQKVDDVLLDSVRLVQDAVWTAAKTNRSRSARGSGLGNGELTCPVPSSFV